MRKKIATLLAAASLTIALSGPASAYHTTSVVLDQASLTAVAGESVTLTGTVDPRCSEVSSYGFSLAFADDGLGVTDAVFSPQSGSAPTPFSVTFTVPAGTSGIFDVGPVATMTNVGAGCVIVDDPIQSPIDPPELRPTAALTVVAGTCPAAAAGWQLVAAAGHARDANGDGYVCVKGLANGQGNQKNHSNVKDNNS